MSDFTADVSAAAPDEGALGVAADLIDWLADARDEYASAGGPYADAIHQETALARSLAKALRNPEDAWGWLPTWMMPEYEARHAAALAARSAPTVDAADVDVWAEWLFDIGYPFDISWPENPPPVDHAVLARLWNERDGWRISDDDAEACVRDAAGLTVADEGDDTDLDAGAVESAWAAEMDRRVAEMRRSPVDYLEAARSSNSVASWLSRALCPTTIRDGCPDSP